MWQYVTKSTCAQTPTATIPREFSICLEESMLSKICAKAGCNSLIPITQSYCETHKGESTQRHKLYDNFRRDPKTTAFYQSTPWGRMQMHILSKYKGMDIYAYHRHGEILTATTVHHIIPLKDSWKKRLDPYNLIPLTSSNHNTIHKLYEQDRAGTMKLLIEAATAFRAKYSISLS